MLNDRLDKLVHIKTMNLFVIMSHYMRNYQKKKKVEISEVFEMSTLTQFQPMTRRSVLPPSVRLVHPTILLKN